jgi:hypothetical protein
MLALWVDLEPMIDRLIDHNIGIVGGFGTNGRAGDRSITTLALWVIDRGADAMRADDCQSFLDPIHRAGG